MRTSILTVLGCLISSLAIANVRYEYTGSPVGQNSIQLFSPTDSVKSFFVLAASPVSGNFTASDFLDFGTQIGTLGIGKQTGADVGAYLEFDPNGNLSNWSFVVGNYTLPTQDPSLIEVWSNSANLAPSGDRVTVFDQGRSQLGAIATPGQWIITTSPIPESTSFALVSIGLLALIIRIRRRAQ